MCMPVIRGSESRRDIRAVLVDKGFEASGCLVRASQILNIGPAKMLELETSDSDTAVGLELLRRTLSAAELQINAFIRGVLS